MTERTKIMLSAKELELVNNTDWILTKQQIMLKTADFLGELAESMKAYVAANTSLLPITFGAKNAKLSKGENYLGLPYVVLDYPRLFSKTDTLAIRTMFWWGNFFSVSLQLSGLHKQQLLPVLINQFDQLKNDEYWVCIHSDPWRYHFEDDNYVPVKTLTQETFAAILNRESFIKLGKKTGLEDWKTAPGFILQTFQEMAGWYINYQDGETNLSPGIPKAGSGL